MPSYELRHRVTFEETNFLGNAYYVHHLRWQGRCREMFLYDHAPHVLEEIGRGLVLVTTRCSCDYLRELSVFDQVVIRMRLAQAAQNRLTMAFDYQRVTDHGEELVARGEQQVAFVRRERDRLVPVPIPDELREALRTYGEP